LGDFILLWTVTGVAQIFGLLFSTVKAMHDFLTKNELGYILGDFFSQTHLVTLAANDEAPDQLLKPVPHKNQFFQAFANFLHSKMSGK
jgi:hypothetical protein